MLLLNLDTATALELLKGIDTRTVQDLALELAYLDATGFSNAEQTLEFTRQFYDSLQPRDTFNIKSFLKEMLKSTVGREKADEIQNEIQHLLQRRDPFISIRSAGAATLASFLENEHPQVVAVVLSELPPKKSSEVLGFLGEGIRLGAVSRMTSSRTVTADARTRIAQMFSQRLEAAESSVPVVRQAPPEQPLRKVAVILRNLSKELRDGLIGAIEEKDKEAGKTVSKLMFVWEDIPQVANRSMQEALHRIDTRKFALALNKADDAIVRKIKSNISVRTAEMIDDETLLLATPRQENVELARQEIVNTMRKMNEKGKLAFIE